MMSLARLAEHGGVGLMAIQRLLGRLEGKGLIRRQSGCGRLHVNAYYILASGNMLENEHVSPGNMVKNDHVSIKPERAEQFQQVKPGNMLENEHRKPGNMLENEHVSSDKPARKAIKPEKVELFQMLKPVNMLENEYVSGPDSSRKYARKRATESLKKERISESKEVREEKDFKKVSKQESPLNPPKANQRDLDLALPDWLPLDAWNGFVEMRRKSSHPLTGRAKELAITKLAEFKADGFDPAEILNDSVMNGWRGLFRPKPSYGNRRINGREISSYEQVLINLGHSLDDDEPVIDAEATAVETVR
jgi:hypothetical protein